MTPARTFNLGRGFLIAAAFLYGILAALIDLFDAEHMRNPTWPPHARLHLGWLVMLNLVFTVWSLGLFSTARPARADRMSRIDLGTRLGALQVAAFFSAGALKDVFGAELETGGRAIASIPIPILHFAVAALLLGIGYALTRRGDAALNQG